MLEIAYEGHQGQVKTKQLWFPGMDEQCKKFVSICIYCQANTLKTHREPLKMTELPEGPWKRVTLDFCGPLTNVNLALVFFTVSTLDIQWLNLRDVEVKRPLFQ